MKASDYRRELSAYRSARERAAYEFYSGREPRLDLAFARERFADLWTREAVDELARALEESPASFETERAALSELAGAARLGHAELRAREASDELARCESATRVEWDGAPLPQEEVPDVIAAEPDAARRHDLHARWLGALSVCDDLRAARLTALREAARDMGFQDFGALHSEATRADAARLAADAEVILQRTDRPYCARLARWAAQHLPPARAPEHADRFRLARLSHLDEFFPARRARMIFDDAAAGFGIRAGRQNDLGVEEATQVGAGRALCFALRPPQDVRLVCAPRAGADYYLRFFDEAARARQLAWASPALAARYPEFVRASDGATVAGFGLVFRLLFTDAAWVGRHLSVAVNVAHEIAAACALVELHDTRRACALVLGQKEFHEAADAQSESLAETYAGRQREATGFRVPASLHLRDALGAGACAAEDLRARLFAASFAEYLRTRHGSRWWASRAAGDELIDAWDTASRYAVEELAPLTGAGPPDAELLAHTLAAAPGGD